MAGEGSAEELLSARTRIWNHAFGCVKSMSLLAAVKLGIPDAVHGHGGPISVPQLASAVGIPEGKIPAFRRLIRVLAHSGIFHRDVKAGDAEEEHYSPTIFSKLLVKDNPTSAAPFLLLVLHPLHVTLWYDMAAWLGEKGPKVATPFEAAHGVTMLESLRTVPELNGLLNSAMACDSRWLVRLVAREYPEVFRGLTSLVDVAGGDGTTARAIKDAFPEIRCTVLEQPHVVAAAPALEGVDFVEGDMRENVPTADAVLLKVRTTSHNLY